MREIRSLSDSPTVPLGLPLPESKRVLLKSGKSLGGPDPSDMKDWGHVKQGVAFGETSNNEFSRLISEIQRVRGASLFHSGATNNSPLVVNSRISKFYLSLGVHSVRLGTPLFSTHNKRQHNANSVGSDSQQVARPCGGRYVFNELGQNKE